MLPVEPKASAILRAIAVTALSLCLSGQVPRAAVAEPGQSARLPSSPARLAADASSRSIIPAGIVTFLPTPGETGDAPLSDAEIRAIERAGTIVNSVKTSDCLRRFITGRAMIETNGASPGQVADELAGMRGVVPVAFYYRCTIASAACREPTPAVAYRQPPEGKIFVNRAHFDVTRPGFDVYQLAGTLAHEGLGHLLGGYDHSFAWTPARDFSVPYSISGASEANDDAFRHCRTSLGY